MKESIAEGTAKAIANISERNIQVQQIGKQFVIETKHQPQATSAVSGNENSGRIGENIDSRLQLQKLIMKMIKMQHGTKSTNRDYL